MTKTKKPKPKLNVRLLRRVRDYILEEPRRLNMSEVLKRNIKPDQTISFYYESGALSNTRPLSPDEMPPCRTVGCIAGTTLLLSKKRILGFDTNMKTAGALLGLPLLEYEWSRHHPLFFPDAWPARFFRAYYSRTTPAGRARVVARVIDDFIATKGWPALNRESNP